ncbi:unnamed protein product [marine sediment metagenome]|uniref:Intein C-terminal splicing domain-containing protein n=1 Tax=marine sediment metagenome TaxID=412755 RepID=X1V8P1_9ZZZZ
MATSSKISMASGYKRAEDVRAGDWLISYDTEAKKFIENRVNKVQTNIEPYLLINGTLKAGYRHPVWCNGKFIPANEVRIGNLLLDSSGREQSVFSIENQEEPVDAYDFVLDSEPHTFFADGYLVHNYDYASKIEICTVSGTTITEGAEVELKPSGIAPAGLAKIDSTHFVIVYSDVVNASKGTSRYCSFSGTTITLGDEEIFHDADTDPRGVCLISPNKIAVVYMDNADVNDIGEAIIGDTPAPPVGLENKSANMGSKMVAAGLI